jgi:thioredoxin-like negative regulator of GroEL
MKKNAKSRYLATWVLILGLNGSSGLASDARIPWITDPAKAQAEATESGRPLLVDMWAIWCAPCKVMEETTYSDPRVVHAVENFVPLKLDADTNEVFSERYGVGPLPTTLFLDGRKKEIARKMSVISTEEMLVILEQVHEGYDAYLANVDRRDDPEAMREVADYLLAIGNAAGAADVLRGLLKKSAEGEAAEAIELDLARALLADEREGAAVKTLRRLSTSAGSGPVRGQALVALIRAERDRGRDDRAEEALTRLREEFPDLVSDVE